MIKPRADGVKLNASVNVLAAGTKSLSCCNDLRLCRRVCWVTYSVWDSVLGYSRATTCCAVLVVGVGLYFFSLIYPVFLFLGDCSTGLQCNRLGRGSCQLSPCQTVTSLATTCGELRTRHMS